MTSQGQIVAVFGGCGFLGSHIVQRLIETEHARATSASQASRTTFDEFGNMYPVDGTIEGDKERHTAMLRHGLCSEETSGESSQVSEIRVFDLSPFDIAALQLGFDVPKSLTVRSFTGSITDRESVRSVLDGCTEVYNTISIVDYRTRGSIPRRLMDVNVLGNRNVIEVCREVGVKRMVYTSTLESCIPHNANFTDGDEEHPAVPQRFEDFSGGPYGQTKAWAEKETMEADNTPYADGVSSSDKFHTLVIRSVGLWGDRDSYHIPNFIKEAKAGTLKVRIGQGLYNHAYGGNMAWGHISGMNVLRANADEVGGERFFIKDDFPDQSFFDFMSPYVRGVGVWMPPPWLSLPLWFVYPLAVVLEWVLHVLSPIYKAESNFTPFSVSVVASVHLFSDAKARRVLRYRPVFSPAESRARAMAFFDIKDPDL